MPSAWNSSQTISLVGGRIRACFIPSPSIHTKGTPAVLLNKRSCIWLNDNSGLCRLDIHA